MPRQAALLPSLPKRRPHKIATCGLDAKPRHTWQCCWSRRDCDICGVSDTSSNAAFIVSQNSSQEQQKEAQVSNRTRRRQCQQPNSSISSNLSVSIHFHTQGIGHDKGSSFPLCRFLVPIRLLQRTPRHVENPLAGSHFINLGRRNDNVCF